jgi:hypothetical protein
VEIGLLGRKRRMREYMKNIGVSTKSRRDSAHFVSCRYLIKDQPTYFQRFRYRSNMISLRDMTGVFIAHLGV